MVKEKIVSQYLRFLLKADMIDYAPTRGCIILKPYGFSIWEQIQNILDKKIKKLGVKNVYFPLFIPERLLKKEKDHIEGFSPELAVVTIGGGKNLKEKLVVRPTSETLMYEMFSKWIHSWRDLPFMVNQWANIVRWEKRPRPFLRTTEFLWQEGHTCHSTEQEAKEHIEEVLVMYKNFYEKNLAISGVLGKKSESEKFPGAKETFTYEILLQDGKALQGCTAHNLGTNFSKVFNIKFKDKTKKESFVWQTCWGFSWRSLGAILMTHLDEKGFILPPAIAPWQVVLIPIFTKNKEENLKIKKKIEEIEKILKENNIRTISDLSLEHTPGWKFNEWELRGVPLRIEVGKKELVKKSLSFVRRDTGKKFFLLFSHFEKMIKKVLEQIQQDLLLKSKDFLKKRTKFIEEKEEFLNFLKEKKGFARVFWCEREECEMEIKQKTNAKTRCLPLEELENEEEGRCVFCQKPARRKWLFAQSY